MGFQSSMASWPGSLSAECLTLVYPEKLSTRSCQLTVTVLTLDIVGASPAWQGLHRCSVWVTRHCLISKNTLNIR